MYFSTLLPPPNLTGILHLGHFWNAVLQDILVKYHLQKQIDTYWGFGVDHAGISLQIRVEEELLKEGISPSSLTKEEFEQKLWHWKKIHEEKIRSQYKFLNLNLPFNEERFTLDKESVDFVLNVYKKLSDDGFIYRAKKLVNWDTRLNTVVSDSEVVYKSHKGFLYTIKYFLENSSEFLEVSTTRPETILADVALFVNPKDERYKSYIGKKALVPISNRVIPILADECIDIEFGTGVMKCTPAHDFLDWNLSKKHNLEALEAFDSNLVSLLDPYKGLDIKTLKANIVRDLGDLSRVEEYEFSKPYSSKSNGEIEPLLSNQLFLKSSLLAANALKYWKENPSSLIFFTSLSISYIESLFENMQDWCISRQLSWGIKIPESEDVFDTWFSSSLWPLIVFENKRNLLPLSILISGQDILFFWILKMIFMSVYLYKEIPFSKVYLHGLVLDSKNRKMSKSLGNGVDPVDLVNEFGLDVVRLFFLSNTNLGQNISFSKPKLLYFSKFQNKLKNLYSFFESKNIDLKNTTCSLDNLNPNEKWICSEVFKAKSQLDTYYSSLSFSSISQVIIDLVWDKFCNKYLEVYKLLEKSNSNTSNFISYIFSQIRSLLYPVLSSVEKVDFTLPNFDSDFGWFYEYMNTYSWIRKNLGLPVDFYLEISLSSPNIKKYAPYFEYFNLFNHKIVDMKSSPNSFSIPSENLVIYIYLPEEYRDSYSSLIETKKQWFIKEIEFLNNRLKSLEKAPEHLINEIKDKIFSYKSQLQVFNE